MSLARFRLDGKVALVTGAGRGIGKGTALVLADAGADMVLVSRTQAELDRAAEEIRAMGRRALTIAADLTRTDQVVAMVEQSREQLGEIDVLVNNAGVYQEWVESEEITDAEWDKVIDVNLKSAFLCSREVGTTMIARGGGVIVNMASMAGPVGMPRIAAYSAAKAGIIGLTRSMAIDWAKHGIRINVVAPAFIAVEANFNLRQDEARVASVHARTPLGRFGTPEEVGDAILFLASDASSYTTGHTLFVDGGWTVP